jgi:hypothetical protein
VYFHNHDERALGPLSSARLRNEWFWNLWSKRLQPFDHLAENEPLGLIVTDANGSTIRFIVNARQVLQTSYTNRRDAFKKLSGHTGLSTAELASNPYTAGRPEGPGFLLAWQAGTIRRVDLPRPAELSLWQHGWGREDDPARLKAWGVGAAKVPSKAQVPRRGQGWQTSVQANRAVELRSMKVAHDWLVAAGYRHIDDVSTRKSWDYEVRRTTNGAVRHVEVKGITGTGLDCLVTRNEVDSAVATPGATILLVVNGIRLRQASDGAIAASDGTLHSFDPWTPTKAELTPESYRWRPKV